VIKHLIKFGFSSLGLKIERRDPLEESISGDYNHSPFLPRIYRGSLDRCLYFLNQLEKIRGVEGDIVECGVSIGHGALLFLLLSQYLGVQRTYYGFARSKGFRIPYRRMKPRRSPARISGRLPLRPCCAFSSARLDAGYSTLKSSGVCAHCAGTRVKVSC
jgi:hypothetical protein